MTINEAESPRRKWQTDPATTWRRRLACAPRADSYGVTIGAAEA